MPTIIREIDVRTFVIKDTGVFESANFRRYYTTEQLNQIIESIRFTKKLYKKLKLTDDLINEINDELVKKEIDGTSL
jgi:hypothetical protein